MANAARRRKGKGSSKAGRPKKEGDRYACGKLKPRGPNEAVVAKRQAGDATAGEHPLDFALSQGWVTERQHRDAAAYRATFNRAHQGVSGPRLAMSKYGEVEPTEALRTKWAEMSDEAIVEIFDRVFSYEPGPEDREQLEAAALERWKRLNVALKPAEREELFMVCVLGSWPLWMPKQAADHALGIKDEVKRQRLFDGLGAVGRAMRPPKQAGDNIVPVPFARTRKDKGELPVRYETAEGIEVQPESERGVPFEVTILRKRA
jgi:hypothetical protein